jgi:hypothetical protein
MPKSPARRDGDAPDEVVFNAKVAAVARHDVRRESAVRTLGAGPVVIAVRWSTENEPAVDWIGR